MAAGQRRHWVIGLAVVLTVLAAAFLFRPNPRPGQKPAPPAEPQAPQVAAEDLILQRNLGLGYLENHQFPQAIQAFEEILQARPAEPFAVRNLAIARVKQTAEGIDERTDKDGFTQARAAALQAIQQLEVLEPKSGLPHFLRAVVATKSNDPLEVLRPLKTAVELEPDHVPWKFQWFELGRQLRDTAEKEQAFQAGLSVVKLAPDNLFVQKEVLAEALSRLVDQAKSDPAAAAAQAEELSAWLERLREPIRVLGVSIQVQAKVNLVALLDEVLAALKAQNWTKARTEFFKIKNLLSQETASDADLIHPFPLVYHDPLNYVALDFNPAITSEPQQEKFPKINMAWKEIETSLPERHGDATQIGWTDVDLDGAGDLVELRPQELIVHWRTGAASGWQTNSLALEGNWTGFVSADLDDDVAIQKDESGEAKPVTAEHCHEADPDFVLFGPAGVLVVQNELDEAAKSRRLAPIPAETSGLSEIRQATHARLVDFDHDGDLDLVVIAEGKLGLWLNRGNFSFQDAGSNSLLPPETFVATAVAAVDWDQDNDVDLLLSGRQSSGWMENLRHGRLRFHETKNGWSDAGQLQIAEFDGDGHWDILLIGESGARAMFSETRPDGTRAIVRRRDIIKSPVQTAALWDYDNDGAIDLCLNVRLLYRNDGLGEFEEQTDFPLLHTPQNSAVVFADVDADGDLDVLAASGGSTPAFANEGGNQNHWLEVRIRAQQVKLNEQGASRRVNHYGIGSTVEVKAGARYQAQIAESQTTRFGLGQAKQADILRVLLTNGVPQNRIEPQANELVCERQVLQTSCPYLFTWNGSRYEFVTDLIWASPLGLNATQTEIMPWRAWEYIKIDGAKLQPQDGEYRLQITEELWEAAYFDHVRLIAVDHPADIQIYTNEKVGSAELAAPKIHTVRNRRPLSAARDQAGRDWQSQLASRDEVYTRNFERKISQGLCDEHYLELDLGPLDNPNRITLFLSGWIRPTDTNINVALDQNPDLPSPAGLALWTPDETGAWREVSPHVGFPNGKTKTIAIDLTGAFTAGDYRLRLVTNREFYWDEAFFTVDDEPAEIREIELPLLKADLHYRGVSRGILPAGDGPETYNYDELAGVPPWPRMGGMFTRYGDVRSLLVQGDDQLLAMGAGDELSLAYRVPDDSLPDGWVRDFVAYHVGWVKDCHLNTWEGERVEPLPFVTMDDHDYWTNRPEDTGSYAEYLRTYQTRRQTTPFRNYVRDFTSKAKAALPAWERQRRTGD